MTHPHYLPAALRQLQKDAKLAPYIKKFGKPTFERKTSNGKAADPFYALCESIVYQQLSGKAASTIFGRFLALFPGKKPTPKKLLTIPEEKLREAGLSGQKLSYLRDLAEKFASGYINEKLLHEGSDEDIREHLVAVKGIGIWTADMFLMFYLHRPDILPTLDLGIQKGFQRLFNMRSLPTSKKMQQLAKSWAPYRTVACRYLWLIADEAK